MSSFMSSSRTSTTDLNVAYDTTWNPILPLARCDIFLVSTAAEAERAQIDLATPFGTRLAMDMEGSLLLNKRASIDVVQLGGMDRVRGKPVVYVWDFARAAAPKDHERMVKILRSILNDPLRTIIVHGGDADLAMLQRRFRIGIQGKHRFVDTQVLFKNLVELMPLTVDHALPAGLNTVLTACGLPVNVHKETMKKIYKERNRGHDWPKFWDQHPDETLLLEYAAFDVDQLVQAADVLELQVMVLNVVKACMKVKKCPSLLLNKGGRPRLSWSAAVEMFLLF
ncbi:hypothetical protein GGF32_009612 [Allomyces javanicus]|nr:hypothetical protein GGF32_009612 [Allomyces javanicus]